MSLDAIAILHVPPSVAFDALPAADDNPAERVGPSGARLAITPLKDACLLPLGISLASEPDAIAARLRELVGDLVDAHAEPRGVPVFPASYTPEADTWAALTEELGEAADWVSVGVAATPDLASMAAMMGGDPAALMGQMGDPSALLAQMGDPAALMQQMGNVDPAALMQQLGGGDPGALMEQAMQMMGQLADTGALAGLAEAMSGAMGPGGADAMLQQMGAGDVDMSAFEEKAQAMLADNPELEEKLRSTLGGAVADGAEGEDPGKPGEAPE